jgi:hypothetical protein
MIKLQQLSWVSGLGYFYMGACAAVGKVLYKIGVQFSHKLFDFQE